MKTFFLALLTFCNISFGSLTIYDTNNKEFIELSTLAHQLDPATHFVLGEYHYNQNIQDAQALIISEIVSIHNLQNNFTVGWEFLNFYDNEKIETLVSKYKSNEITSDVLISSLFAKRGNETYIPIFEVIKKYDGQFLGLNVGRDIRAKVVAKGLESIDQSLIPPNFELGSENYFNRFKEVMSGGHAPEHVISKYFLAQCLTDSVMANTIVTSANFNTTFTIAGSFHTDYFDGFVAELEHRSVLPVVTFKIVDEEVSDELITPSVQYGAIADYIVFTRSLRFPN